MSHISFSSEIELLHRALEKEHVDNFINSPGLNQTLEGQKPISRRQLTRKLYNQTTSYPIGKIIEYYLEGSSALVIPIRHNGKLLYPMKLEKLSFSHIMNKLYDGIKLYSQYCNTAQTTELQQLKTTFAQSQYQYEHGRNLEGFLTETQ